MKPAAFVAAVLWGLLLPLLGLAGPPAPASMLADRSAAATPVYELRGAEQGPTVLVTGGIHGDERAPPHAVKRLLTLKLARGRLLLIPEVNRRALAAGQRFTPGARFRDLNRNFPIGSRRFARGPLARSLWQLTRQNEVDWLIDVHEGFDFNRQNPKSVGSSVTYVPHTRVGPCSGRVAREVVDAVNRTIDSPQRKFTLLVSGPESSFARSASEALTIPSLVLETTRIGQPLELRVAQHEHMLRRIVTLLGLRGPRRAMPCAGVD